MFKRRTAVNRAAFPQAQPGFGRFVSLRRFWRLLAVIVTIISLTVGAFRLTTADPAAASQLVALAAMHTQDNTIIATSAKRAILKGGNQSVNDSIVRQDVVNAAKSYLGKPYKYETGWTCSSQAMDCECLNRHAIWDGTSKATGTGLQ